MKKILTILSLFQFFFYNVNSYSQQAGSLDTTFGINGINLISYPDFYGGTSRAGFCARQNSGKLVSFYGNTYVNLPDYTTYNVDNVTRYNADGTKDTSFGLNGAVDTSLFNFGGGISGIMNQQNDKILILIMGVNSHPTQIGGAAIYRLNINGTLDTTFGVNGIVYIDSSIINTANFSAICLPDDSIVYVVMDGFTADNNKTLQFKRYTANGAIDTLFGTNGTATYSNLNFYTINNLSVQNDGKLLLSGNYYFLSNTNNPGGISTYRFNANGTIDTAFCTNGNYFDTNNGNGYYVEDNDKHFIQPDGKIIVAGKSYTYPYVLVLYRLNANGTLDTTFGANGYVTNNEYSNWGIGNIVFTPDNKMIVVRRVDNINLIRYTIDGTIDNSFGNNGSVLHSYLNGGYHSGPISSYVENGKLMVFGLAATGVNLPPYFGLMRVHLGSLANDEFTLNSFKVYPNPTINELFFDNKDYLFDKILVINQNGQVVMQQNLSIDSKSVNLEQLPIGVYNLKFVNSNKIETVKIIKK